jgi:hypothetical protein
MSNGRKSKKIAGIKFTNAKKIKGFIRFAFRQLLSHESGKRGGTHQRAVRKDQLL